MIDQPQFYSYMDYTYLSANSDEYRNSDRKISIWFNGEDITNKCFWCHVYKEPDVPHYGRVKIYTEPKRRDPGTGNPFFEDLIGVVIWRYEE